MLLFIPQIRNPGGGASVELSHAHLRQILQVRQEGGGASVELSHAHLRQILQVGQEGVEHLWSSATLTSGRYSR